MSLMVNNTHHYNMDLDIASGHVFAPNSFTMEFRFVKLFHYIMVHLLHGSFLWTPSMALYRDYIV